MARARSTDDVHAFLSDFEYYATFCRWNDDRRLAALPMLLTDIMLDLGNSNIKRFQSMKLVLSIRFFECSAFGLALVQFYFYLGDIQRYFRYSVV